MSLQRDIGSLRPDDIRNLILELQHVQLGNLEWDEPIWALATSGSYKVSATYHRLVDGGCRLPNMKTFWESKSPIKVRIFMWLIAKNAILKWEKLQKRGWMGPGFCILCKAHNEDMHHLLLNCPYLVVVWSTCMSLFRLHLNMSEDSDVWTRTRGYKSQ